MTNFAPMPLFSGDAMRTEIIRLRYGNTNTFYISGSQGGLLIDTDYAGTLQAFFRAVKTAGIDIKNISYVLATHYHPDHIGIISELQKLGIQLLIIDVQKDFVHFADHIFAREKHLHYEPISEKKAKFISCSQSREFLESLGIRGEIIHTPSHSPDSISIILDSGECFTGDLEPIEYLEAYEENPPLKMDWERIMCNHPKKIFYAHVREKEL